MVIKSIGITLIGFNENLALPSKGKFRFFVADVRLIRLKFGPQDPKMQFSK